MTKKIDLVKRVTDQNLIFFILLMKLKMIEDVNNRFVPLKMYAATRELC